MEADVLHASIKLCILHAFFGFERIWAKVHAHFLSKIRLDFINSIWTFILILLKKNALKKLLATSALVRRLQFVYFDHGNEFLSQFCYSLMYLMLLLFWLMPNLANKYSKIFSFIVRACGNLKLCRWIFWAHIFF